ncbi:MAG TPA: tetratricopeptide repeat protein, partial [Bryobacteraceae bacterium]|nr:tetratricopeptide repeat protein [Bryobacteraceae bacterium]
LLAILAGMAFVTIDSVLASTERRETALEAVRLADEGRQLMKEGKYDAAIESFRAAIANQRESMEYPLELGRALRTAGRLQEAESTLEDLLKSNAMDGSANLAIARVFVRQGDFEAASFYYHRAIYGQWKADNLQKSRLQVRFELADLLARNDRKQELLAELLPLQTEAPGDSATQQKLADLFLTAGSPVRAEQIYRDQLRIHPRDAALRNGLNLTDQILRLDPLRPELSERERFQRSLHILEVVTDRASTCLPAADLIQQLPAHTPEENLAAARHYWEVVKTNCPKTISEADKPLDLVLAAAAK